jgi:hypothetical protein
MDGYLTVNRQRSIGNRQCSGAAVINSKLKTQNSKLKTQNSKLKTQNSTFTPHSLFPTPHSQER